MAKSRSFGGIPLSMSWYTGPFPPVQQRKGLKPSPPQQPRTVVLNPDTEDRIELKLAPVQEGYGGAGGQAGSGSRSWGDNLGKKEVVTWGEAEGTRHGGKGSNLADCVGEILLASTLDVVATIAAHRQREIVFGF